MLEIKNICKAYATKKGVQTRALDGVSIAFPEKGLVFILGKSGCGKSTLLNICGGLDRADKGEIVIKGRSSADFTPADFDSYRNTFVGFVFQEYNVLEEFTVEENISVALELQGKKRDAQKVADILRSVEMEAFAKRKPNTLSGGQKQRVAIARALVKAPQIILADEPTGALDSDTGRQVLDTLKRLSADKLVIAVSHDREFAERYADRIIELKDGKVLSDVTRAGEAGEAPNVRFYEDTVTVRDCAVLTEEDFAAIRRFLSSSGSGAMLSCDRAEVAKAQSAMPSAAGKFEETHGSPAPRTYAAEEQQFIRSKMPFRHAFRMGASCVRTRPVRLAFSIFLCLVAFVMFGLFSTVIFFDASKATQDALYNADFTYLNYSKGYSVTYNVYTDGELTHSTTYVGSTGMTAEEYEALQERYDGTIAALETGSRIGLQGWNMQDRRFYTDTFAGYAYSAGNADMPDLLWGRYPQNAEEAAISDFTYNCLRFSAYTDPQTGEEIDIETYEDLNALPALALPGATVKIVGVYRGEQVPEKFEELRAASEEQTNSTTEIEYEWADVLEGGFYTYLLMHDSFAEQFRDYIEEPAQEGQIFESDYFLDSTRSAYILCEGSIEDGVGAFNTYTDEHGLPLLPLFSPQTADRVTSLGEGEIALPLQVYVSILSTHLTAEVDGRLADADIGDAEAYERTLAASDAFYDGDPLTGAQSISDILDDLFLGYTYTEGTDLFDTPVMRPFTEEEIGGMLQTVTAFMQEYAFDEPAFSLAVSSGEIQRDVQVAALFYESSGALDYCAYLSPELFEVFYHSDGREEEYITEYVSPEDAFIAGAFVPGFRGNGALEALTDAAYTVGEDDSSALIRNGEMEDIDTVVGAMTWLRWFTLGFGAGLTVFAVLLMFNFIASSITAKKREIGILRALGARGTDVYKVFFSEALIVAGACFLLGAVACAILCPVISNLIVQGMGITVTLLRFTPLSALFMAAVALFTAAISTLVPVAVYSKKPPVESIRSL